MGWMDLYALASDPVADGSEKIGYMYREEDLGEDSGWRVLTGREEPLYFMEPDCMTPVRIRDLITNDPQTEQLFLLPTGTKLRRTEDGTFTECGQEEESGITAVMTALAEHRQTVGGTWWKIIILIAAAVAAWLILK